MPIVENNTCDRVKCKPKCRKMGKINYCMTFDLKNSKPNFIHDWSIIPSGSIK
jgi:hypothetical protein